jgi:hypothetical protein
MSRYYRYKLPPWARHCLIVAEKCTLPIMIYQIIRTFFFPTTLDVFLTGIFVGLFFAFRLKLI